MCPPWCARMCMTCTISHVLSTNKERTWCKLSFLSRLECRGQDLRKKEWNKEDVIIFPLRTCEKRSRSRLSFSFESHLETGPQWTDKWKEKCECHPAPNCSTSHLSFSAVTRYKVTTPPSSPLPSLLFLQSQGQLQTRLDGKNQKRIRARHSLTLPFFKGSKKDGREAGEKGTTFEPELQHCTRRLFLLVLLQL